MVLSFLNRLRPFFFRREADEDASVDWPYACDGILSPDFTPKDAAELDRIQSLYRLYGIDPAAVPPVTRTLRSFCLPNPLTGDTSLHTLCLLRPPAQTVKEMIDLWPEMRNIFGGLRAHLGDEAIRRALGRPCPAGGTDRSCFDLDRNFVCYKNWAGATALHTALCCGASAELVNLLLDEGWRELKGCSFSAVASGKVHEGGGPGPASLFMRGGTYPLHVSCMNHEELGSRGCDAVRVVRRLVIENAAAVNIISGVEGRTALSLLWRKEYVCGGNEEECIVSDLIRVMRLASEELSLSDIALSASTFRGTQYNANGYLHGDVDHCDGLQGLLKQALGRKRKLWTLWKISHLLITVNMARTSEGRKIKVYTGSPTRPRRRGKREKEGMFQAMVAAKFEREADEEAKNLLGRRQGPRQRSLKSFLHAATSEAQCPPDLISLAFLRGHYCNVACPDLHGRLPLHLAAAQSDVFLPPRPFCQGRDRTVVGVLLEALPSGAKRRDGIGRLPLHYAAACTRSWWESGLNCLVKAYPEGLESRDPITGLYPFMLAGSMGEGVCHKPPNQLGKISFNNEDYCTGRLTNTYELLRYCPEILSFIRMFDASVTTEIPMRHTLKTSSSVTLTYHLCGTESLSVGEDAKKDKASVWGQVSHFLTLGLHNCSSATKKTDDMCVERNPKKRKRN